MKLIRLLSAGLLGAIMQFGTTGSAEAGPAFTCSGDIYQVQSGQLRIFDPITSSYQNVGPRNGSYNGTGFNVLDNFAYASQGRNVIRISSDGTIETLFDVGFGSYSGDVDYSNNFYMRRSNNRYARVNLLTGSVTNINFSGPGGGPADVAFVQDGGTDYLIGFSGGGTLYRYNLNTQVKTNTPLPGIPGGGYGATWTDSTGRLLTFNNNSGILYEVENYLGSSPSFKVVGFGDPSGNNDGFSCSLAPFPNLPPLALDDDFETPVNTPISGDVFIDNGSGIDEDPDGGPITANTTPISGPSNGSVTLAANGTFTYTPAPGFIGTDTFVYEITDNSGLTAQATVTIVVTGDIDFTIEKTQVSGPNPVTAEGQVIGYQIVLENIGDIPLTGVNLTDVLPDGGAGTVGAPVEAGGTGATATGQLDINETWTYTLNYTVTQDDIDAGLPLTNEASATTSETGAAPREDSAVTEVTQSPAVTIVKNVDLATVGALNTLTYTITVDNTGNQTLTNPVLTDLLEQDGTVLTLSSGPNLTGDADGDGAIDVTEVWTYTATYDVTQDELDNGSDIVNTATLETDQTATQSDDATTSITQTPAMNVVKTSDSATLTAPGLVTYQIVVDNTGNIALTDLTLTDTVSQGGGGRVLTSGPDLVSGDTDSDLVLDAAETWTYAATYQVTQGDIDNGADVVNAVTVSSNEGAGDSDSTPTAITQAPSFTINKVVDTAVLTAPGTLRYDITIANTGNVSLTGVNLTDALSQNGAGLTLTTPLSVAGDSDGDGEVDVSETWVVTATYDAGQGQIDDGNDIVNEATFSANGVASQSSTATTSITQTDALTLMKAVAAGEPTSFAAEGDEIDFTFVVENTGNTTVPQPITIDDDEIGNGLVCSTSDLLPGNSVSCTFTWTATQADVDAGAVTNTATANGSGGITSPPQQETVTAVQSPALSIDKVIIAPVPTAFEAGQTLFYEYTVTNTGNVTLAQPITVADNLTTVTCPALPAGGLEPLAGNAIGPANSIICSASYVLGTNDEELGSTTNVANATTTFNGATVTSPSDSAIFPVDAQPVLGLEKAATPENVSFAAVGDEITYSYTLTNQPPPMGIGASLTEEIFINDDKLGAPFLCYDPDTDGGSFQVNDTHTCFATYTVTQDDLDAGEVVNEAVGETVFAPASPSPVNVSSNPATETVTAATAPSLSVTKTVTGGPDPADAGDTITYQIVALNNGNQTLSNVMLDDPLLGSLTCDVAAPVTLAPDAALTCTGSYEVQQSDLDNQTIGGAAPVITNTATAAANDPSGAAIPTAEGSVDHPLEAAAPAVTILKELFPDPAADPAFSNVGDVLRYRMTVTNTGNVTLSSVDVTDDLVPGTCTTVPIDRGDSDQTCFFEYTVDQGDLDAGEVENTASASAQPSDPAADPVTASDELTSPGPDAEGALVLTKAGTLDVGSDGIATPGDLISYVFVVRNTGNVTLNNVAITDPNAAGITYAAVDDGDGDGDIDVLAPGSSATVTATHALTQSEINAGQATNSAIARGTDPSGANVSDTSDSTDDGDGLGTDDPTVTPIDRSTGLSIVKTPSVLTGAGEGDVITYSYLVTNTGNTDLTNVTLSDQHTSAAGTVALGIEDGGVITNLGAGDSVTLTATYTVTQEDIDAGDPLTNVVDVTGDGPAGMSAPTGQDTASVEVEGEAPELEALKTVRSQTGSMAGDTILFEVRVENTGNVSVSGLTLADTLRRADGTTILPAPTPVFESGDSGTASVLDVGEIWVYAVTYQLTQDDIDAGGINNSVRAEGTSPAGTSVSDVSDNGAGDGNDATRVIIPAAPALQAVKTITSSTVEVGETVRFEITVENTGNVTLSSVGIASDNLTRADGTVLTLTSGPTFQGADALSGEGSLQLGETATYVASYVLTQDDIDAGGISNTATATGAPPLGAPVSDVSDDNGAGDDPTDLVIAAAPEISMVKALATGSGPSFDAVGDVLDYTFTVTNDGNVTLTTPITVDDPLITDAGGLVSCPAGDLAPDDDVVCTGSYEITQEDLDAGEVVNAATANVDGADPASDGLTVPAVQARALEMTKAADSLDASDFIVGAVASYTYTTTNTGNVTITAPITVSDNLIPAGDIVCAPFPADGLAPGDSYVCTADYTVTGEDVQLGVVTNTATASDGETTSPLVSESIPNDAVPALSLDKEVTAAFNADLSDAGSLSFDEVGDILEYTFTVTNAGTQSFAADITVEDALFDAPIVCFSPTAGNPDLIPGEEATCTGRYAVTQADLDAGEVLNEALAQTEFGVIPTIVTSGPATETTPANVTPLLETKKTVAPAAYTAVDEVLTYSIVVTNAGNQTISTVDVVDPLLPALSCSVATLAPGDTLNCTAPYTVTQADIDRGEIENTATASGIDPFGDAVPDAPSSATATGPSEPPSLEIVKTATPSPFGNVGSTVLYRFAVQNTSIYTLTNIEVAELLDPAYSCTIASLAPGETDSNCTYIYEITQADVDEQQIINTASAAGLDPFGNTAADDDTITTVGPPVDAQIRATKLVSIPATTLGQVVDYTLLIENPGNVSLNFVTITDTMMRADGSSTTLDAPFAFVSGDDNGNGLLTPGETWTYTASHEITQADINAGGFENTVTVTGQAPDPDGPIVSDVSDDGDDGDGNTEDDPTVVEITSDPVLVATKTIVTAGAVAGDEVVFEITARNAGNVDIFEITTPVDMLLRADGTDISAGIVGPTPVSGQDGTLSPAEVWTWDVRYVLVQEDIDAGGISNSVTINGEAPLGVPISDISDDGDDGDGNVQDDPTELSVSPTPSLEVIKTLVDPATPTSAGEVLTFEVAATNTGNVTLSDVSAVDMLTNLAGDLLVPVLASVDGLTSGALAPGLVATFTYTYALQQADIDAGGVENTATVSGDTPSGVAISDVSDDDGTGTDDPTRVLVTADPSLEVEKTADVPTRQTDGSFVVNFAITVENIGNVTHENLSVLDDLTGFIGAATLLDADITSVTGLTPGDANAAYDGVVDTEMLATGAILAVDDIATINLMVTYDTSTGAPGGENTVSVSSDRTAEATTASVSVTTAVEEPGIIATKTASPSNPRRGDVITYTLTFENPLTTAEADLSLVDRLPVGLVYIDGSATFDGAATPEPTRTGRNVIWSPVTIGPGQTVTLTLQARLIDGAGRYVNEAYALGVNGGRVSNTATAVIEVRPEAVFDCSDVIGKVFDDVNGNGRQDGPDGRAITNDDVYDKFSKPAAKQGEPGLPRVRLATTRGTLITTDEYGRFSVPCAELPGKTGSNFTLKLDTRSLPSGYRVTTENPRVMRLTAGKLARMNFGARLGNVVDIDLIASAFQRGKVEMTPRLETALTGLLQQIRETPSVLRLSYIRRGESLAGANARLDQVERFIKQKWKRTGRYRLDIERVIARVGEGSKP